MTEIEIAAPLAAALKDKGYDTLTAVQQAVLGAEAAGRDLLVSAQTGSGKTVAFGIAAAPELLDSDGRMPEGTPPLALAIAPTRELALQVAAELGWLFAATGARIATCVGGMDYRTERRALERGAQIVVGTPGRLRDHIERGGLDLSALRVAVLDEADEMLDLGFREDLEFILGRSPAARRTLMFSATVPPAIEKLARDFQRDGLRLAAMGEARQHGDITYRALSVTPRDRENAIFNLLRYYEARTSIVFCKTRANVAHLMARMNNRGFRVVALSGELSQEERTRALQSLRDGRAQVCIATDVAARGIDLPGLELVIHADLPTNSETLLHRSGRTGRAGAKGVSALIVTPSEYRKAQRLLQGAKLVADWGKAPSADEVRTRDEERIMEHPALAERLEDMTTARALLDRFGPEQVAAAFVRMWREGRPAPEELADTAPPPGAAAAPRPARDFGPSVWFELSVGHTGRAEARWLLPKICDAGGITRDDIGAIRVREDTSYVQIATGAAGRFGPVTEIAPGLVLCRSDGEPPLPDRYAPRAPARPGKPAFGKPASGRPARARVDRTASGDDTPAPAARARPVAEVDPAPVAPRVKERWSKTQKDAKAAKPRADMKAAAEAARAGAGKAATGKAATGKAATGKAGATKSGFGKAGPGKGATGKPARAPAAAAARRPGQPAAAPGRAGPGSRPPKGRR